jgi:hypothetical protein
MIFSSNHARTTMKSLMQNSDRRNFAAIMTIAATMLVASLLSPAAVGTAEAAKGNGVKAPAPRAATLTVQEQIGRNQGVRPVERPRDMSLDRECKGPRVPKKCHRHQH